MNGPFDGRPLYCSCWDAGRPGPWRHYCRVHGDFPAGSDRVNDPVMGESVIERLVAHAVRNNPDMAIKEMLRLIKHEAELEQEIARLKETYGVHP